MSVEFAVNDVQVGDRRYDHLGPEKELEVTLQKAFRFGDYYEAPSTAISWAFVDSAPGLLGEEVHPFVAAATRAFAHHLPLRISPDHLWAVIVQGLSLHVHEHAEQMRHLFVAHEGKKELCVDADYLIDETQENWRRLFADFRQVLDGEVAPALSQMICAEFSTTGPIEMTVFQAMLMELLKDYYEYRFDTLCGIPSITLDGEVSDWIQIKERVQMLDTYGLDWWRASLEPIIDEFILAAQGNETIEFWVDFVKRDSHSGGDRWSGWVLKLFPYIYDEQRQLIRNPHTQPSHNTAPDLLAEHFPSGTSKIPITWGCIDGTYKMEIVVGFLGSRQNQSTLEVSPQLGWAIRYK